MSLIILHISIRGEGGAIKDNILIRFPHSRSRANQIPLKHIYISTLPPGPTPPKELLVGGGGGHTSFIDLNFPPLLLKVVVMQVFSTSEHNINPDIKLGDQPCHSLSRVVSLA